MHCTKLHSTCPASCRPAGAAAYLAAQSVVTVGSLLWSAGRAAMPKAGRRVADAAVALACTAAAAVALS